MVRDMLRIGKSRPHIEQTDGPFVRTSLIGGAPDLGWLGFLREITPTRPGDDLDILTIFTDVDRTGWTDNAKMQPLLQHNAVEIESALHRAAECKIAGHPVIEKLASTPVGSTAVWVFSDQARLTLRKLRKAYNNGLDEELSREQVALDYAAHRGRISSTELAQLTRSSNPNRVLRVLEESGVLAPSRATRSGRGFYYKYQGADQ